MATRTATSEKGSGRRAARRYLFGAVAVAAALGLTLLLWPRIEPHPTALFLAAVAVTAWRAGLGASLLATALSAWAVDYFFISPVRGLELTLDNVVRSSVFVLVALLISYIDDARRRAAEERDRLLARERAARAEAERANRAKDEFLAMVSHELRTPLGVILGWTNILRLGGLGEAALSEAVERIEHNAHRQTRLIEDLLDTSRMAAGKFRIEPRPTELAPVLGAAVETAAPSAAAKGVAIREDICPDPLTVEADPHRLQQVFWNLLSNAVKFTPAGGSVTVRLERAGAQARVTVQDTGQGISAEFLPHVFERFRQGDGAASGRRGGLGLGLAIARQLAEMHGGTVKAESGGEGLGATFTVSLPLSPAALKTSRAATARQVKSPTAGA
jgi:signal transduction histidine kinase